MIFDVIVNLDSTTSLLFTRLKVGSCLHSHDSMPHLRASQEQSQSKEQIDSTIAILKNR